MTAIGLSILAAFGFASSAVLARQGMQAVYPLPGVMVSLLVSFIFSSGMVLLFASSDIGNIPKEALLWIIGLGVVSYLGGRCQNFLATNLIGASRSSLFISTQAPFAAMLAVSFTGETVNGLIAFGTVGVVCGLLFSSGGSIVDGWRTDKIHLLGYVLALGAGASYGASNVMAKQAIEIYGSPIMVTAFSMLIGLVAISPMVGASASQSGVLRTKGQGFVCSILGLRYLVAAGLASSIAVTAVAFAVQRADVVVVSPIVSSSPLITLFLSHTFLARLEQVTPKLVAGTFLAIAGVILVVLGR